MRTALSRHDARRGLDQGRQDDAVNDSAPPGLGEHKVPGTQSRACSLGRVIRTLFLLKYLNDPELRRTIHAATNKSEQFNDFAQWLML